MGEEKWTNLRADHVEVSIFFQLELDWFLAEGFTQGQLHPDAAARGSELLRAPGRLEGSQLKLGNREYHNKPGL